MRRYDIVHTHNSSPQLFASIAAKGWGGHLVSTEHNTDNRKRHISMMRWADLWMYEQYDKVICISEQTERNLRDYLGVKWTNRHGDDRLLTIRNGVDVALFREAKASIERGGKTIVVMVAAFRPQKDHYTLLRTMTQLTDDYHLWLVGDGEMRKQVEVLVDELGLSNRVRFFGNRVDVPEIVKSADIVVLSSNWEGFGLAAVEGMAAGRPVVVSDVDGLRQIVEGYGLIFQRGDDETLTDIIIKLSSDNDYYNIIAEKCYQRAKEYDLGKMVEKYEEVYKSFNS